MLYLQLFLEFFKTGLFAVGGGLATLPFLQEIAMKHPDWFTTDMLADMLAVSESTPGPLGINMATYAGFHAGSSGGNYLLGILGGLTATLSLILPSIIVIILVAKMLDKFNESKIVKDIFYGLRPAVAGLIAAATLEVMKVSIFTFDRFAESKNLLQLFNWKSFALFGVVLIITRFKKIKNIHPIVLILAGAVVGIIFQL